ncbi:uncharacterized protein LOC125478994 [Pyrus x bretschneideri]|uniref:uncharacterized protein LOC125478994 n=1 Tax=Pyrus x bretschneideri TaxID=225117 RepID=UPI00203000B6|nr:uncharacterized protein LOC125478994 [Pyrus x bretschneideri]
MAYGSLVDSMDEAHGMSESTCLDTLAEFCDTIVKDEYLYEPNQEDLDRLIRKAEDRGFPGIIGSLDCIHWDWKNCPTGWQEGFSRRLRKSTIVLKVVTSLTEGKAPQLDYYINDCQYNMRYYLAYDIYLKRATLVQAIPNPANDA